MSKIAEYSHIVIPQFNLKDSRINIGSIEIENRNMEPLIIVLTEDSEDDDKNITHPI